MIVCQVIIFLQSQFSSLMQVADECFKHETASPIHFMIFFKLVSFLELIGIKKCAILNFWQGSIEIDID